MKVFYRAEQTAHVKTYYSPSMYKPELVVADWQQRFGIDVCDFDQVVRDDFYRVHDRAYVDGVLDLSIPNGFGGRDPEIAGSLPFTSGSMCAAALSAFREGGIACSPTSGFHHAGYDHGGGYCTFNGLMVAVVALLDAGANRIAIVDLDMHYGDGTQDILNRLALGDRVDHWTLGPRGSRGRSERHVLHEISSWLADCLSAVDVVLYQAGADSHEDDPLGGVFSTSGYRERDRLVFETAAEYRVPVAWNLAGGYQHPVARVIDLHRITFEEASRVQTLLRQPEGKDDGKY
jgi:acetoin utilization deacetylase AcuC-like enzyme